MMTLVPLTQCCLALGVDPKTLRLWLQAAQFSSCLHPADARLKCLTLPQLQQLAELHGRPLPCSKPGPSQRAPLKAGRERLCSVKSPTQPRCASSYACFSNR
jgi:hypothetical protein